MFSKEFETSLCNQLVDGMKEYLDELTKRSADKNRRYFNSKDAAEYLGVSRGTLRAWVNTESLPMINVTGSNLFDKKDLDEFMARRKIKGED
ncbi:helix-turn-helix domain-containing protein [Allofustis seminis]|uniref:helix-turn-helix domain-containing protein n=1 Tax=Allofustis seminis TaxID=166939 RepID=UPI000372C71D|nr:helix-turn-helix domain-containing protein [Allofustis seminis]